MTAHTDLLGIHHPGLYRHHTLDTYSQQVHWAMLKTDNNAPPGLKTTPANNRRGLSFPSRFQLCGPEPLRDLAITASLTGRQAPEESCRRGFYQMVSLAETQGYRFFSFPHMWSHFTESQTRLHRDPRYHLMQEFEPSVALSTFWLL